MHKLPPVINIHIFSNCHCVSMECSSPWSTYTGDLKLGVTSANLIYYLYGNKLKTQKQILLLEPLPYSGLKAAHCGFKTLSS